MIAALLYLPFGKFFHIFQRPAQLGVKLYQRGRRGRAAGAPARAAASASPRGCTSTTCKQVAAAARASTTRCRPAAHWQDVCPACKRKNLALMQDGSGAAARSAEEAARWLSCPRPIADAASTRFGPHLELHAARRLAARIGEAGPAGEDPLLLLRPAVRHPAEGRDNQVVGFEPWEEFPFNRGMLCPKGVKRYLQDEPPRPAARPAAARRRTGFRAGRLGRGARPHRRRDPARSRSKYGNDAFAVYGGASLTTEKAT